MTQDGPGNQRCFLAHPTGTDQRPFEGDYTDAVIYGILHEAPRPMTELRSDLPPELAQVVARCLQKGKERRYETASALLAEPWQQRLAVDCAVAERAQARARRNGILAGGGVLVVLLAGKVFLRTPPPSSPPHRPSLSAPSPFAFAPSPAHRR